MQHSVQVGVGKGQWVEECSGGGPCSAVLGLNIL